jgi:hypothetical protein
MGLYSFHRFGDCDHLYVILYEVDNYPNIEDKVHYAYCRLTVSFLNLGLDKILLNLRNIMLDYDINAAH